MSIRLLIADDHEVVRLGLKRLVAGTDITVVGEAATGEQAVQLAGELQPDVVLLDIRMSDGDGLAALTQLKSAHPRLAVVMLTMYDNPTYFARASAAGACGYVLKGASREEILAAIREAAAGTLSFSRDAVRRAAAAAARQVGESHAVTDLETPLTRREFQVLIHITHGRTNKEIGDALGISAETIKEHVQNLLAKLSVSDRTQAAVWAVRNGLVE